MKAEVSPGSGLPVLRNLGLWVPVHGPQNHQAGSTESCLGFRKNSGHKVFQMMFPFFKASVFDNSLREGSSHLYCHCCLKHLTSQRITQHFSGLNRIQQGLMNLKKTAEGLREEVKLKSPGVLSVFLTSNAVIYCKLFMKKLHSSLTISLFYCFLEVFHLHVTMILSEGVTVRNIHYI